jgi:hypothetical protein
MPRVAAVSRAVGALGALLLGLSAHALETGTDPPGRVARVSEVAGAVSLQPRGAAEWIAAPVNRPLTAGDRLWSAADSRVALDLGSIAVRLGGNTALTFFALDDHVVQMQLTVGTVLVRVRELAAGQVYEIDTPNVAVTLRERGSYRVSVGGVGDESDVSVREGNAQVDGPDQSSLVHAGQVVRLRGTSTLTLETASLDAPDDLDSWAQQGEHARSTSVSSEYVAPATPGLEDLDQQGTWQYAPDYGYVWAPFVTVPGWAPYRYGYWVWIEPWGWTWIDGSPWGFAPFHYGRWVLWNSAWCWVPPPRVTPLPIYTPAAVGWLGSPGQGGGAYPRPRIGWFPLAPREPYRPSTPASAGYVRRVNLTNTTFSTEDSERLGQNVHERSYRNNVSYAITAVPPSVFSSGQRVNGHTARLEGATVLAAPGVVPERASVAGVTAVAAAAPPPQYGQRAVLARTPPYGPASLEHKDITPAASTLAGVRSGATLPPAAAAPVRVLPSSRALLPLPAPTPAGGSASAPRAVSPSRAPSNPSFATSGPTGTQNAPPSAGRAPGGPAFAAPGSASRPPVPAPAGAPAAAPPAAAPPAAAAPAHVPAPHGPVSSPRGDPNR